MPDENSLLTYHKQFVQPNPNATPLPPGQFQLAPRLPDRTNPDKTAAQRLGSKPKHAQTIQTEG